MSNSKPLVSAALICEKVLNEKDGVISAIRIVDTIQVPKNLPKEIESGILITTLISLRGGEYSGEGELTLRIRTPDGNTTDVPDKWKFLIAGNEVAANFVFSFLLRPKHLGVTYIDAFWNAEFLTSIPMRLVEIEQQQASAN